MSISNGRLKMIEELVYKAVEYGFNDTDESRDEAFRLQKRLERSIASLENELAKHREALNANKRRKK